MKHFEILRAKVQREIPNMTPERQISMIAWKSAGLFGRKVLLALVLCVLLTWLVVSWYFPENVIMVLTFVGVLGSVIAGFTVILSSAFYEDNILSDEIRRVSAGSVLLNPDHTIRKVFEQDEKLWRDDPVFEGTQEISTKPIVTLQTRSFHPISANPKVRDFEYTIEITASGNVEKMLVYLKHFGTTGWSKLPNDVEYELYEFDEKFSKELAQLYNPLDEKQQQRFTELAHTFLDSHLALFGGTITSASFS